jgi:biopolymer transport protein ExbD
MAMAMASDEGEDEVINTINTTPLVDVMLVLLIIFLITIPVVTHTIPVKLPAERNQPYKTKPENVTIAVNKDGDIFWGTQFIADTDTLLDRLKEVSVQVPQPEVHIRGDQNTRYEFIGKVIVTAQRAGIAKVGFITEPPAKGG